MVKLQDYVNNQYNGTIVGRNQGSMFAMADFCKDQQCNINSTNVDTSCVPATTTLMDEENVNVKQ